MTIVQTKLMILLIYHDLNHDDHQLIGFVFTVTQLVHKYDHH